ncbi:unnamed protein product, partial [Darwinula stevensoni]
MQVAAMKPVALDKDDVPQDIISKEIEIGSPYFTTDSAAALRANEINANVILKGTRVDGIYDSDPEKNPNAVRYDKISFAKVISMGLSVMDMTAFTLCQENNLPIIVFDINEPGHLTRIANGENI